MLLASPACLYLVKSLRRCQSFNLVILALTTLTLYGCSSTSIVDTRSTAPAKVKLEAIVANAGSSPPLTLTQHFTEAEINELLVSDLLVYLPAAVSAPRVQLRDDGHMTIHALFDTNQLRTSRRRPPTALSLFGGKVSVTMHGQLQTHDGEGRFIIDSAVVNGVPMPGSLVRDLAASLSRSRKRPAGIDISQTFPLPEKIKTISVRPGHLEISQ